MSSFECSFSGIRREDLSGSAYTGGSRLEQRRACLEPLQRGSARGLISSARSSSRISAILPAVRRGGKPEVGRKSCGKIVRWLQEPGRERLARRVAVPERLERSQSAVVALADGGEQQALQHPRALHVVRYAQVTTTASRRGGPAGIVAARGKARAGPYWISPSHPAVLAVQVAPRAELVLHLRDEPVAVCRAPAPAGSATTCTRDTAAGASPRSHRSDGRRRTSISAPAAARRRSPPPPRPRPAPSSRPGGRAPRSCTCSASVGQQHAPLGHQRAARPGSGRHRSITFRPRGGRSSSVAARAHPRSPSEMPATPVHLAWRPPPRRWRSQRVRCGPTPTASEPTRPGPAEVSAIVLEYTGRQAGRSRNRHTSGRARKRNGSSVVPVPRETTTVVDAVLDHAFLETAIGCARAAACRVASGCRSGRRGGARPAPASTCPSGSARRRRGSARAGSETPRVVEQRLGGRAPARPATPRRRSPATSMVPACALTTTDSVAQELDRGRAPVLDHHRAARRDRWWRPPRGFR